MDFSFRGQEASKCQCIYSVQWKKKQRFAGNQSNVFSSFWYQPMMNNHLSSHSSLYHSPKGQFRSSGGFKEENKPEKLLQGHKEEDEGWLHVCSKASLSPFSEGNSCMMLFQPRASGYSVYLLYINLNFLQQSLWTHPSLKVRSWNKIMTFEHTIIVVPALWFQQGQL